MSPFRVSLALIRISPDALEAGRVLYWSSHRDKPDNEDEETKPLHSTPAIYRVVVLSLLILAASVSVCRCEVKTPLPEYRNPAPDAVVRDVLAARTDIWGEIAMRQPNGASYEFFRDLLPPLRYVDPDFRHYPILLSAPEAQAKGRLLSNGSAVNPKPTGGIDWRLWKSYPVGATIRLGADNEPFGSDLDRLDGPRYLKGHLPIVQMSYRKGDACYEQEAFIPVKPPYSDHAGMLVRLSAKGKQPIQMSIALDSEALLEMRSGAVCNDKGEVLLQAGEGWQWDANSKTMSGTLKPGSPLIFVVFSEPVPAADLPPCSESAYQQLRKGCIAEWERILAKAMRFEAPEEIVNTTWKALIVGSIMCMKGDAVCYGGGNGYERQFLAECEDTTRSLMVWGFVEDAKRMTVPLLHYVQPGLKYHEAGHKLQLLSHVYWMTRDSEFVRAHRDRWYKEAKLILDDREADTGLLPRDDYAGDIAKPVYSLNSGSNAWRGLRDIAAVIDETGDKQEARTMHTAAAALRRSIVSAVEKSEDRTTTPPFIPNALFGEEKAYDVLTSTKMGSYWNLLIPYVLGSGVFGVNAEREGWIVDYLQQHGGIAMGMIRFHQESNAPDYDNGLDDLYGLRYTQALLRRDDPERALVSFYGKMAQGMTRDTFISAEGTGLVPLDKYGRAMSMPPNSSANALFLTTLRELLVQDQDMDDDGRPDTLRLLFATPRSWMRDGAVIRLERAATMFGDVSIIARSSLKDRKITVDVAAPPRAPKKMQLRARVPHGWRIVKAHTGDTELPLINVDTVDISGHAGKLKLIFTVERT